MGLAGKAVEEARERVKTAINNSGLDFPPKKITVNLAPADLPKDGGAYDLPIAVGILTASGQVPAAGGIYYGELSLDGTLRATKGVLLVGLFSKKGEIYVPVESANEAAVVEEVTVYPVRNLQELVDHLNGVKAIQPLNHLAILSLVEDAVVEFDLSEVAGQEQAKRALLIAAAGIIGGGTNPLPGEVSLAHLGVLFLDEMAEFPRNVLESLRQPMEDGVVSIVRVAGHVSYPASFTLLAAVNPCPCGYLGHPKRECKCTEKMIRKYRGRISGPILDRIDLHVRVPAVEVEKLSNTASSTSVELRKQVIAARVIQDSRFTNEGIYTNSQMRNKQVKKYCKLDPETERLLRLAVEKYDLSARSYFRLIKVARTIADLADAADIAVSHMAEALQYRQIV
ncbi:MAG: Competence protein ComM [Candidatus Amesbacteria bacterium GW2011_GWC2_47_8]|uniref:Competence protein ComM n=2 Tax=Candidatus Amesiibacteriota TaxID=1752730 RepID=A0A0G1TKQ4_9BACT|nr:MAG: Competence protein ComM [Candidatus Amesbacteria bacterium GW2011_GWC2_47_8]